MIVKSNHTNGLRDARLLSLGGAIHTPAIYKRTPGAIHTDTEQQKNIWQDRRPLHRWPIQTHMQSPTVQDKHHTRVRHKCQSRLVYIVSFRQTIETYTIVTQYTIP